MAWAEGDVQPRSRTGGKLNGKLLLQDLEHADDTALVSDSMDLLEELFQAMEFSCFEVGL